MNYLYEAGDMLNNPVECFRYDTRTQIFPVRPHWHYYMEIIYMLEGSAEMRGGSKSCFISEKEMIVFHPKVVHSIFSADGRPLLYEVVKLDISRMNITASYSPKLRSIFRSAEKGGADIVFTADETEKIGAADIFSRCISEINTRKYGFDLVISSELYRLLIGMIRCWQDKGFVIGSDAFAEDSRLDIYSITEYIDENMSRSIKVSEIAEACGMSYPYFAKKFLAIYGKTCKEYIEEMRICKAEEFLAFTDFDLNYISQETGFSDCSHMIKSFRQYRGTTPGHYRRKKSGQNQK